MSRNEDKNLGKQEEPVENRVVRSQLKLIDLPAELLLRILGELDLKALALMARTSKFFHKLTGDFQVQQKFFPAFFKVPGNDSNKLRPLLDERYELKRSLRQHREHGKASSRLKQEVAGVAITYEGNDNRGNIPPMHLAAGASLLFLTVFALVRISTRYLPSFLRFTRDSLQSDTPFADKAFACVMLFIAPAALCRLVYPVARVTFSFSRYLFTPATELTADTADDVAHRLAAINEELYGNSELLVP